MWYAHTHTQNRTLYIVVVSCSTQRAVSYSLHPPWTVAHQTPLPMARLLEWVAISYSTGSFDPGIEPISLAFLSLTGGFFTTVPPGKLLAHKTKWNSVICSNMDRPRYYHNKWSKSDRERQTPYDYHLTCNVKNIIQINLLTKQKQTQIHRKQT